MSDWFTVQFFLSGSSVNIYTVDFNTVEGTFRCNCPGFGVREDCKHVDEVRNAHKAAGLGPDSLPIQVKSSVTAEEVAEATKDPAKFRNLMARNAKIKVV